MQAETTQVVFQLQQLIVPPGNTVQVQNISWQMFETILSELGEGYAARLAYNNEILEIKMPLPGYEFDKEIIGDLLKALLEELNIDFISLGSTTFKRQNMQNGIEHDQCFYIQNEATIRGKREIDLNIDPPPDLAVEIDNTSNSRLRFNSYQGLGVSKLWRYSGEVLYINLLQQGKYIQSSISRNPKIGIIEVILQFIEMSKTTGRNSTLRSFRNWVREQLQQ